MEPIADRLRRMARQHGWAAPSRLDDDQRVVELFENRAQLKKAYAEVQASAHALAERLRQQEAVTRRAEQGLAALRLLLADTRRGPHALIHHQLVELWTAGQSRIVALVEALQAEAESRERPAHLAALNREGFERRQRADDQLKSAQASAIAAQQLLREGLRARALLGRRWQWPARRKLDAQVRDWEVQAEQAQQALELARRDYETQLQAAVAPFPGVGVAARRAINISALALGQVLLVRVARSGLLPLALQARASDEPAQHGDLSDCQQLMGRIAALRQLLISGATVSDELRQRAGLLQQRARYRQDDAAIPVEESVDASTLDADPAPLPSLLRDDLWGISQVLLA